MDPILWFVLGLVLAAEFVNGWKPVQIGLGLLRVSTIPELELDDAIERQVEELERPEPVIERDAEEGELVPGWNRQVGNEPPRRRGRDQIFERLQQNALLGRQVEVARDVRLFGSLTARERNEDPDGKDASLLIGQG